MPTQWNSTVVTCSSFKSGRDSRQLSKQMAIVATQTTKDNGLWQSKTISEGNNNFNGVIEVVHSMVENLDKSVEIQPHSVV